MKQNHQSINFIHHCLKRISEGQTAVIAYPSAFSGAKVAQSFLNSKGMFPKVLKTALLRPMFPKKIFQSRRAARILK